MTFAELDARARATAAELRTRANPGDRALLLVAPCLDYLSAFFGCLYAGIIAVPAYPPAGRDAGRLLSRLVALMDSAGPAVVVTHDDVVASGAALLGDQLSEKIHWLGVDSIDLGAGEAWRDPAIVPSTVAFVQYTSGSTGLPRGVVLTHDNLMSNLEVVARRFGTSTDSVGCSWLPPYHDMGLIGAILQPVYRGFPMVLMSPESFVRDPARWLRAISTHRATVSGAPNFAYEMCVRRVSEEDKALLDLSSWTVAFNGAEPVRADTMHRFADAFSGAGFRAESFYPCYGLAEATLMVTGGAPDRAPTVRRFDPDALGQNVVEPAEDGRELVSSGAIVDDHELVVVDSGTRKPCPPMGIGELWVRGPSVAQGYWDDEEGTESSFGARLDGDPLERKFLRTGDLGFVHDGEVFVAGRSKDLLVVRGRNHHPADVEATIAASHPALRVPGVVFGLSTVDGTEDVIAVHEANRDASEADLRDAVAAARRAVADRHGLRLAELLLVDPGTVPRTSSGKPQRGSCRENYLAGELAPRDVSRKRGADKSLAAAEPQPVALAASASTDEASMALRALALVSEPVARQALVTTYLRVRLAGLLNLPIGDVRADAQVAELGLDSLTAIEFLERVHTDLGGDLTIGALFDDATPATLAVAITSAGDASQPVPRADEGTPVPLSHAQRRLWFMHQINPDSAAYHVAAAFRLHGELRVDDLAEALRRTAREHEALRTVVRTTAGVPTQVALSDVVLPVERINAVSLNDAVDRLGHWARRPFRLDEAPLARAALVTLAPEDLAPEDHVLALVGHHIVCDAASIRILLTEVGRHYAGASPPAPATSVGHLDFAQWQQHDARRAAREVDDLKYWRERLQGVPPLGLPSDRPRPQQPTNRGAGEPFVVPAAVTEALAKLGRAHHATPFMVLLAAWQLLLFRHSGQPDIAIGVPVSNRDAAGVGGTVGCFVDTLVLRSSLHGDPPFRELLERVRDTAREAYAHPAAPFDRVVEELNVERSANRNPLFEASFSMFPEFVADPLPGIEVEVLEIETGYVQFDLVLEMMNQDDGLRGRIRYTTDLYDQATVRRMADQLARLLDQVAAEPDRRLSEFELVTGQDWARLLAGQPAADPFGAVEARLQEPFEAHAARFPDDVALVDDQRQWTYGEADARANQIAHLLREFGVGPEVRVGLSMATTADLIVTVFGILKSGGAYTPVEPTDPPARIRDLLVDAGVRVVLTDNDAVRVAVAEAGLAVVRVDLESERIDCQPRLRPAEVVAPHHLSYIIFTSGSTGRPKGVAVEHRHIVSFVRATADYLGSRRGDEYAMVSSIAADLGLTTLLPALRTGGKVHVVTRDTAVDPVLLAARFRDVRLDHLKIAPSHLSALLLAPAGDAILPSRTLVLGGEAVSWELVDRVREHRPEVAIVNEYGPTETAVANIIHFAVETDADRKTGLVPMSVSLGGNRAYVLDESLRPVPIGVPGELFLGGPQVGRGYLNRAATTAERFLPDPYVDQPGARMYATGDRVRWLDEATMEFFGRIDNQVKVRGFRVEPGEIENVLRQHDAVRDAVVIPFPALPGGHSLAAYVVLTPSAAEGSTVDAAGLREYLRGKVPRHMVPSELLLLPKLPVLAHGKVDLAALRALPRPSQNGTARFAPAANAVQRALSEIWRGVLGVDDVGVADNFFDVGGHSLLLLQLQHRIGERFGREVTVVDLMTYPTIEAQAAYLAVDAEPAAHADDPAVARAQARKDARRRRDTRGRRDE